MERVRMHRCLTLVIFTYLLLFGGGILCFADEQASNERAFLPTVDVSHDLVDLGIYEQNATPDRDADHTDAVQAAVDYVSERGGGIVYLPAGQYNVSALTLTDGVKFIGAGPDRTVVRSLSTSRLVQIAGKDIALMGMTLYGTRPEGSGDNWRVGIDGVGRGGTATALHNIFVGTAADREDNITENVVIDNVGSYESRYDALYIRTAKNIKVSNSKFDRAGRCVLAIVGATEDFTFTNCYFGSYWGLYHVDLEPTGGRPINDGAFINCVFDGSKAGERETDTWGSFLCFTGHYPRNYNVSVIGCEFRDIYVRIRGIWPEARFIGNIFHNRGGAFVRVSANPFGEFQNTEVRDNKFFSMDGTSNTRINRGAAFTGNSVFVDNYPASANEIEVTEIAERKTEDAIDD